MRVPQERGETAGHRPRARWVLGGGVVICMTACLTVAVAAVVVTLLLVAVTVDGVALSLHRSFLQYFVPFIAPARFSSTFNTVLTLHHSS